MVTVKSLFLEKSENRTKFRLYFTPMRRLSLIFLPILTFAFIPLHAASCVSQSVIDSLVDRAYYILTSVDDPGSGMTREKAIHSAKAITSRLHALAADDVNSGYILGKAKELEGQIYLEEKGLLLETGEYTQKRLNDQIVSFNRELGKRRPSLRQLWACRDQMAALEQGAGADVERAIKKRASALALEVPQALRTALEKGLADSARSELVYCEVNRDYLGFSATRYAALEAKVAAKMIDADEQTLVRKSLDGFKTALADNDLAVARRENAFIDRHMRSLRSRLLPYEWNRLNGAFELSSRKFHAKEDSLVSEALMALRKSGPAAAERQLDAMKIAGISPERTGEVDRAIFETVIRQKRLEPDENSSLTTMPDDSDAGGFALSDMLTRAKKRAAEKKDSLAAAQVSLARATQVEEVRKERLQTAGALRELREKDKKLTEKEQALAELVDIYTFLELQKSKDAYQKLIIVKTLLKSNIPLEDYEKVTAAVERELAKSTSK
jgi:hypothetical protein